MEKKMYFFTSLMAGFFCLVIFSSFYNEKLTTESPAIVDSNAIYRRIVAYDLHQEFNFAGEAIPKDNFDAVERLDRELLINSYLNATTLLNLKIANRFFPVIEPILKQYGIPEDFKYLSVAESNLRMATSPSGAKGFWQFMEEAGKGYGLEINSEVDERYHVEKSTEAACKFILHLKQKFGSWTLAAAAYNMGEAGITKRLEEQKANNYYDLNLNEETSRYIFRIIAIKEIMNNPKKYGFYVEDDQLYAPLKKYSTVIVTEPIPNLASLAQQYGTSFRMLKVFNPWLIGSSLTNKSGKKYEIRIPVK
ncbi:MAG: lytic transglycosylase domain-containing protein [Saprospiraceae bacterium]